MVTDCPQLLNTSICIACAATAARSTLPDLRVIRGPEGTPDHACVARGLAQAPTLQFRIPVQVSTAITGAC